MLLRFQRLVSRIGLISVVVCGLTVATGVAWAAPGTIVLDSDGKTVRMVSSASGGEVIVEVERVPQNEKEKYELRYDAADGTGDVLLDTSAKAANRDTTKGKSLSFTFTWPEGKDYVAYNLWRQKKDEKHLLSEAECDTLSSEMGNLTNEIDQAEKAFASDEKIKGDYGQKKELEASLEASECKDSEELDEQISAISKEIEERRKQVSSVEKITAAEASVAEIRRLYEGIDPLVAHKAELESRKKNMPSECAAAKRALEERIASLDTELKSKFSDYSVYAGKVEALASKNADKEKRCGQQYTVLKMGILIQGKKNKSVYYDLRVSGDKAAPLQVVPLSSIPILNQRSRLLVVIANWQKKDEIPGNFKFSVSTTSGSSAVNSELVRPSFDATTQALRVANVFDVEDAYHDLVFPSDKQFKPFDTPRVTLSTMTKVQSADQTTTTNTETTKTVTVQQQELKLLDDMEYPIVHGLYRYNFVGGVVVSDVRDFEFNKVKIADDDPATMAENETRYRTDKIEKARDVTEVFALTYYWREVDILEPITFREAIIPNPTLGFGVTNPGENVFVGFSHSVARNVQLIWGWHFGKIDELKNRDEVSEEQNSADPLTRKRSDDGPLVGLTFNLKVLTSIFKKG